MRVIVTFRDDPKKHEAEMKQYGKIIHVSRRAGSIIMDIPDKETLHRIADLPEVVQVAVDRAFRPQACAVAPPSRLTNAGARALMGADSPFPPTAVKVAVIDTGIVETDKINVVKRVRVIDEETSNKNHGTWVAHTIAGYPVETTVGVIEGVIPGNPIIDAPVIHPDGYTTMSTILMALDMVADEGATVINMSLASPSLCSEATNRMMESLAKEGIIMVVAGGNFGKDHFIGCPANSPYTIAVGSVYYCPDPKGFIVSDFSTKGPDFSAIGGNLNPQQLIVGLGANGPVAMAGTSMATPFVTGASAIIKNLAPQADIGTVRYILANTAFKPQSVPDPYVGYGVLNFSGISSASLGELEESPFYPQSYLQTISPKTLAIIAMGGALLWLAMRKPTPYPYSYR